MSRKYFCVVVRSMYYMLPQRDVEILSGSVSAKEPFPCSNTEIKKKRKTPFLPLPPKYAILYF